MRFKTFSNENFIHSLRSDITEKKNTSYDGNVFEKLCEISVNTFKKYALVNKNKLGAIIVLW